MRGIRSLKNLFKNKAFSNISQTVGGIRPAGGWDKTRHGWDKTDHGGDKSGRGWDKIAGGIKTDRLQDKGAQLVGGNLQSTQECKFYI